MLKFFLVAKNMTIAKTFKKIIQRRKVKKIIAQKTIETDHYSVMVKEEFNGVKISIFSKDQELLNYFEHKHGYKKKDCGFVDINNLL